MYVIALIASVYVGVYAFGHRVRLVQRTGRHIGDYPDRALAWAMYSFCQLRSAIIRSCCFGSWHGPWENGLHQSHLIMYC